MEKVSLKIRKKFRERLKIFLINQFDPILENHSVDLPYKNTRSINVTGDYRALYIETGQNTVMFTKIGTHSELYK